ncbi:peptide/nickel transport system substrate-binding protein [Arthrobacter sp. V4I6]|uniref:ABC transporter family substrate-binding protein n=1 Tax=unclassified Arthrobacter TaxID=235627 RepID=UPI00278725C6|nr:MULTISPECIES: ABC transporter family substrate-binding protein [unclassified Arthrobacter]MDQ0820094.1 peptide/nickel transport system substrate-binding protein [Arthrobacter sp. V1I7]MDQ0854276.1 peptide/nickel transport system substrate-binding protein [Arthrobacter sp. V4I6]
MRWVRTARAVGVAAAVALALGACAGNSEGTAPTLAAAPVASDGSATVIEVNAFNTFNPNTAEGNTDINAKISYATHSGFFYLDNKLNVVRNEKFGKMEKTSDNPLTVKYTINEGVKWSDGTPVTAADLLLQWAAFSGFYDDADPEAGTGTSYFSYAGDPTGVALTDFPELGADNRSMTLKYSKPFADWEVAIGGPGVDIPAHVLATRAGLNDVGDFVDLLKNTPRGDAGAPEPANARLRAVAEMWNTGFDTTTLPADPILYLSNGPYIVKAVNPDRSLTMVRNKDYNWGPEPRLDEITVRSIGSAAAQVQALKDGEADIIALQPAADTVDQLTALQGQGVTVDVGNQLAFDHIDLNYTGPFAEKNVREAFLKTVPRKDIVDKLVKKLDPKAAPLDSQMFFPAQAPYADAVKDNGSSAYQDVDIDAAKKLLDGATPEVRILYNRDNPNRVEAYSQIRGSAAEAGFRIVDGGLGASDWGRALGGGTYDAAIFGWISTGVGVTGVPQVFKAGNDSNFNRYTDPEADRLMDELIATTDRSKQDGLIQQIDRKLWDSAYGLPLFQTVGVVAYSDRITGVKHMPTQTGVWWNFWEWTQK